MDTSVDRNGASANTATQPRPFDPSGAMAGSDFLQSVKDQFFDKDNMEVALWPGDPADSQIARAKAELPVALEKLFHTALTGVPLPAADPTTALGKLKAAATAAKWPTEDSKIPDTWPIANRADYRMYEVAYAVNLMIRAFCDRGGGGGPRDYPPPPDNP
jgi:hypothetical protein